MSKTTTSHVHHTFLYISLPFLHDNDLKVPSFAFYGERKQATTKFYFSFWTGYSPRFPWNSTQDGSPTFDKVSS